MQDLSTTILTPQDYPLDYAIAAWLHAHSSSPRTLRAYQDTFSSFRAALDRAGLAVTSAPRDVALVLQGWASAGDASASTHNQRLAIISSFYRFAQRRQLLQVDNPAQLVDRCKVQAYASAVPLSAASVTTSLRAIDRSTLAGKRDYALLAVALHTGRRVAELADLRRGDVAVEADRVTLTFTHAKGGKVMRDTLPVAVGRALLAYLAVLDHLEPGALIPAGSGQGVADTPLWVSRSRSLHGQHPLTSRAISLICADRLGTSKVHALRHTFARTMEDAGAKVSEIQARLGHSSLATTGRYLAALHSAENTHAETLAALFGVE